MKLCMGCMEQIEDQLSTCPYCGFNETALRQESYYLDPGTVVGGKYIVGRVLSYGGHTVSYLGMDAEYNRKVVVKEYLPSDFSTRSEGEKDVTIYSGDGQEQFEQGLTNFLNEANRIQHLQDAQGIAKVYDCVAENETGYVISEYVEGQTLKEILDGGKKYTTQEALSFICQILQGLARVHEMDIVHCDISPETIMVTSSGEIKLMDFGATRYVTTANSKSLSIILKRGYAPEEQYRSKGQRGPWTDVYALGAVMYRMITGIVPQESVERTLSDELKEPSKLGVSIPKNTENALMNALNVYQRDRTPSAEIFLQELNSPEVKRIKTKQQKNKTGKFPVWAKGLVAGLACLVVVGGVFVIRNFKGNSSEISTDEVVMLDLSGKTYEEVEAYVNQLKDQGVELQLETGDTVFDLEKDNGTVYEQSIKSGTVLKSSDTEEQMSESQGETEQQEDTLTVQLYSNDTILYSEINNKNAYELAKKLGVDTNDETSFIGEEGNDGDEDKNYYDLISLKIGDQEFTFDELNNTDLEQTISYRSDITIYYYATDFFYWKELPDFTAYGTVDQIPKQQQYQYSNENDLQPVKKKSVVKGGLVDDSYYTLEGSGYEKGSIVGQTVGAGETYDATNPGDTELKIKTIGTVLSYAGKTGKEFEQELQEAGFGLYGFIASDGSDGKGEWYIESVKAVKATEDGGQTEEVVPWFQLDGTGNDRNTFFIITVKKPVVQTESKSSSGGSSSGGSTSGGSSSGGSTSGGSSGSGEQLYDANGRLIN